MYVLGIQCGHDGSVALSDNGKLVAYIATERLTRVKKERGVNKKAIKYVLDKAGIKLKDISFCAVVNWFWDRSLEGAELWDKDVEGFSIVKQGGIEYSEDDFRNFYNMPGMVAEGMYNLNIGDQSIPCMLIDHHFAHCATAFYLSSFDDAVCFSVDFADNMGSNHSVYYFNHNSNLFRPLRRGNDFNVGSFYGQICDFLGFYPSLTDAGKVMALAAYGSVDQNIIENLSWPNIMKPENFLFHGDYYQHLLFRHGVDEFPDQRVFYPQLKGEGGKPDKLWLSKDEWNYDLSISLAANAQAILERSLMNFVSMLAREMNETTNNLCLAGGTILNCVANGRILNETLSLTDDTQSFSNLFIPPCPGDDGLSVGASIFLYHFLEKRKDGTIAKAAKKKKKVAHTVKETFEGGRIYTEDEISDAVESAGLDSVTMEQGDLVSAVCKHLDEGKIVGWFQGGSEMGPRALCHRSILADPREDGMKDRLNSKVKHREEFRPFAPVVLEAEADNWFEVNVPSPYMLYSVPCKLRDKVPSACHIDATARLQTVGDESELIFILLSEWFKLTEIPILINTSFNVQGEPIVESPEDAIVCFMGTEIDVLVIGNIVIEKG